MAPEYGDKLMQAQQRYKQSEKNAKANYRCPVCFTWRTYKGCPNIQCPRYIMKFRPTLSKRK